MKRMLTETATATIERFSLGTAIGAGAGTAGIDMAGKMGFLQFIESYHIVIGLGIAAFSALVHIVVAILSYRLKAKKAKASST